MVVAIIFAMVILIASSAVAYHLGKNDGIEIAFGEMERVMETVAIIMKREQQEKENFENIFKDFK